MVRSMIAVAAVGTTASQDVSASEDRFAGRTAGARVEPELRAVLACNAELRMLSALPAVH